MFSLLLVQACSDYDLEREAEADATTDTATVSPPEDTDLPVQPGDPGAAYEGSLYLVSECRAATSDTLLIHSVGDAELTVQEVNVLSVSDGSLTATPGAALPAVVPPGGSVYILCGEQASQRGGSGLGIGDQRLRAADLWLQ